MTDRLHDLAGEFSRLRAESKRLRSRLDKVRGRLVEIRPEIAEAIAEDIRGGHRTAGEVHKLTGYTMERIRQICRAAGVEPTE